MRNANIAVRICNKVKGGKEMYYKIENIVIKGGMLSEAQDRIPKMVQPHLDAGVKKGWKLHTFTPTESAKGINICLIWEVSN